MTQDKIKRIHRFYGWGMTAMLIVIGILMILSCLDIYHSGPRAYSAENIAVHFKHIAIPVYVGVIGIVGGIALNIFFPVTSLRAKSLLSARDLMLRMRKKVSTPPVKKEIQLRFIIKTITAIIFIGLMIVPAICYLQPQNFSIEHLNRDVVHATIITLIPCVIGLTLCWICQLLLNASYRREMNVYKQALANGQKAEQTLENSSKRHCPLPWAQLSLVSIAVILIIVGIINGGAEDVLKKAIAICTECIGLG